MPDAGLMTYYDRRGIAIYIKMMM